MYNLNESDSQSDNSVTQNLDNLPKSRKRATAMLSTLKTHTVNSKMIPSTKPGVSFNPFALKAQKQKLLEDHYKSIADSIVTGSQVRPSMSNTDESELVELVDKHDDNPELITYLNKDQP